MANNRTITAANSVLLLSAEGLFDVPQRIQGFSADNITSTDSLASKETLMGVDGRLSAGWVAVAVPQTITLQADSPSNDFFDALLQAEETAREAYVLRGSLVLPAIGKKYSMSRGFLTGIVKFPAVGKTLAPRAFTILWEKVTPANT
jgi:hypothetical protein